MGYLKWWYNKDKKNALAWIAILVLFIDMGILLFYLIGYTFEPLPENKIIIFITMGIVCIYVFGILAWMLYDSFHGVIRNSIREYNKSKKL